MVAKESLSDASVDCEIIIVAPPPAATVAGIVTCKKSYVSRSPKCVDIVFLVARIQNHEVRKIILIK